MWRNPRLALRSLRVILGMVGAAAVVLGCSVGAAAQQDSDGVFEGRFVEYEFPTANLGPTSRIGPMGFAEMFHPAHLGPDGRACTTETVTVLRNEITLSHDTAGGPVVGEGLLELECEYHPGCGAVTRTVTSTFAGSFDPDAEAMSGKAEFATLAGEATAWGTTGPGAGVPGCLDRWELPGEGPYEIGWTLDLATDPPLGYMGGELDGGDPATRIGYFSTVDGAALVGTITGGDSGEASATDAPSGTSQEEGGGESTADGTTDAAAIDTGAAITPGEQTSDGAGGVSGWVLALGLLTLAVIIVALTYLTKGRRAGITAREAIGEASTSLVVSPTDVLDKAEAHIEQDLDDEAKAAKIASGPQYTPAGPVSGTLTVYHKPVQARSPSGATLTLPEGEQLPAGDPVTEHGQSWVPVRVGEDWWWVPKDSPGCSVSREEGPGVSMPDPGRTPERVTLPPYTQFELTRRTVFEDKSKPGQVTRHELEPGKYQLGTRHETPDGTYYDILDRVSRPVATLKQADLPPP